MTCQFLAQFQQISLILIESKAAHKLKLFHSYLFMVLVTDYVK